MEKRSPTRPISATWKMGASSSLLMAMMVLGILHAGKVLDGAGDADGDVDFGGDDLAGLAHLVVVGHIARVHRRAARPHARAQLVRQRHDRRREGLRVLQRAPARDDDLGRGQFGTLALGDLRTDEAARPGIGRAAHRLDGRTAAVRRRLGKGRAAHRDHQLGVAALHRGNGVARVDRPRERLRPFHRENVRDLHHVEQRRHARRHVLARRRRRRHERVVVRHQTRHQRRHVLRQRVGQARVIGRDHLGHARDPRRRLGHAVHARARHQQRHLAQLRRRAHRRQRRILHRRTIVFDPYQCLGHLRLLPVP